MNTIKFISLPKIHSGFSHIDILVGIVVHSIGLLGIAGLQTTSSQENHHANMKTLSVTLSPDPEFNCITSFPSTIDWTEATIRSQPQTYVYAQVHKTTNDDLLRHGSITTVGLFTIKTHKAVPFF